MVFSTAASSVLTVEDDCKCVRFSDDVGSSECNTGPITLAERREKWYSMQELINLMNEVHVAVHFKDTKSPIVDFDWRGLEQYQSGEDLKMKRRDFVSELLSLQYKLRYSDVLLHERVEPLSLFSAEKSKQSCKEALKRAKQDEETARMICEVIDVTPSRRNSNEKMRFSSKRKSFISSLVKGLRRERNPSVNRQLEVRCL